MQIQKLWIIYSESLIAKYEYVTFQTYFLSLLVMKKMNKVFYIILISLFSLTVISCSSSDDEASTTTDTTAPTVSSFYPTDNQTILVSDNISVTFSESMDNTSVTTNTLNTSCSG